MTEKQIAQDKKEVKLMLGEHKRPEDESKWEVVVDRSELAEISKNFNESLKALKNLPTPIDNDTSGVPIFSPEDIDKSVNKLDILMRMLFIKYRVTKLSFARQFQKFAVSVLHIPEMHIISQKDNYLRSVRDGALTWSRFEALLAVILELRLHKIILDLVTIDGRHVTITSEVDNSNRKSVDQYANMNPLAEPEKRQTRNNQNRGARG